MKNLRWVALELGLVAVELRLETLELGLEAIVLSLVALELGLEAIVLRLEALELRLEALVLRLVALELSLEALELRLDTAAHKIASAARSIGRLAQRRGQNIHKAVDILGGGIPRGHPAGLVFLLIPQVEERLL